MKPADLSLTGLDRREYHRARFFADVEIERGDQRFRNRISDITLDGLLIETSEPLAPGTEFHARVFLPEPPPLEVECIVKRVVEGVGMGVVFAELAPAQHARLRKLVDGLPH
jgi:hypothetical protein